MSVSVLHKHQISAAENKWRYAVSGDPSDEGLEGAIGSLAEQVDSAPPLKVWLKAGAADDAWVALAGSTRTATLAGGTANALTEAEVVAGDEELTITLVGDAFVEGDAFDAVREAILAGLVSDKDAEDESAGFLAEVVPLLTAETVVRTSAQVVTITLPAAEDYDTATDETLTVTLPAAALLGAVELVATPTLEITADA